MPITDILERNCKLYGNDICLVEINPEIKETRRVTWKEYELMEPNPVTHYRREITWSVFNETVINPPAELGRLTDAGGGEQSIKIENSAV